MQCNIVVIGGDHYNTYGVVRSLGEKGIRTNVIIQGNYWGCSYVEKSKYVDKSHVFFNDNECISTLLSYYQPGVKNFVIACSDVVLDILLDNHSKIADKFILPVCKDYAHTRELMDKSTITEVASKYGLDIPRSWVAKDRKIPTAVIYPCITKPLSSVTGHKSDIVRCNSQKELECVIMDPTHCSDYQIQEYLDFEKEVSILGVVLSNGDVIFSGCIDKLRTCMIGTSSFAVMKDNSLLGNNLSKLEKLLKESGYTGLFSAEFLLRNNNYYFLEVNFRNDGNGYVVTCAGMNTPYLWVKSFFDTIDLSCVKGSYPCYFMLDIEDFLAIRNNRVSLITWIKDCIRTDCFLVFNIKDIKPFAKKASETIKNLIYKLIGNNR